MPWKRLVVALDRVPEQKLSYLLLPGRGMFTQTLSWFTLFTALSMIVRSSIFSGSNLVGKLEQIVSNNNSKGMMIVLCSLASSCCYIQLALNAFSIGCAGLNSYFGPMRPFFLGLTAVVQEAVWRQALAAGASRGRLVASSVATAMLSLLPEILYFYQSLRRRWKRMLLTSYLQQDGAIPSSTTTNTATRNVTNISNEGNYVSYTLRTQGMGCVACTQKIQKIVDRLPFIVESSINLENGIVTVKTLGSSDMWHEDIKQLCVALSHQGYPSNIFRTNHYDWSLL